MNGDQDPDLRIVIAVDAAAAEPPHVMHPCRCDAPDPEATRMEPLEVPLTALQNEGRALVVCPECDSRVLIIAAGRERQS
jgi:hypothetical protein